MSKRKYTKKEARQAAKVLKRSPKWVVVTAFLLVVAIVVGYFIYARFFKKPQDAMGTVSFHFMVLGNRNAGDCTYIKAGENDILIDAGSRANSVDDIQAYIDEYVTDGKLEYVIVTHADQDHIAGFAAANSIFDIYDCDVIIDFSRSDQPLETAAGNPTLYADYLTNRDAEVAAGAKHYTALDCYNNANGGQRIYNLAESVNMEILYNYYYEHPSTSAGGENDYSVCLQFTHGDKKFLFTGDLEEDGEEKFVEHNKLSKVELFKLGHHGSPTSSNDILLEKIQPEICVACCCAGSVEYTQARENTFPSQAVLERIAKYTPKVYVPIMVELEYNDSTGKWKNAENYQLLNGNIVVTSDAETGVTVNCSNNNTLLKDTDWIKEYRDLSAIPEWSSAA